MAIQIASNNLDSLITFPADKEIYYTSGLALPGLQHCWNKPKNT